MGVHTGDSITEAPAMTLTDVEYQKLRNLSLDIIREVGVDTGGCNIQFAVNPDNGRIIVIEDDLVGLMAERAKRNNGSSSIEAVLREEIQLIEIAVILVHLVADAALQSPLRRIIRPTVTAVHENDLAGERALRLLR
jgi:hypothetical protein